MALVLARHEVFGDHLIPEARLRLHPDEWTAIGGEPEQKSGPYDPLAQKAPEVLAYLEKASASERVRVLEVERQARRPRKTVLAFGENSQPPAAVGAGDTPDPAVTPAGTQED